MFCTECGKEIETGGRFCPNCGTTLSITQKVVVKRSKKKTILISIVILLIVISSSLYWFFSRETAKDYFPPEGTTKVLEYKTEKKYLVYQTVGKMTQFQGKNAIPVFNKRTVIGGPTTEYTFFYDISSTKLQHVGSLVNDHTMIYEPPFTFFRYPLKEGLTWEEKLILKTVSGGPEKQSNIERKCTVLSKEKIDVPAGKFEGWKIQIIFMLAVMKRIPE